MFCPKCGKGEQNANNYCRGCGEFLPDFEKKNRIEFGGATPEEQIRTNLVLNLLSALVSLTLGILLLVFYWKQDVNPLINISAAFLIAMSGWQASTFFVGLKLRRSFQKRREGSATDNKIEQQNKFDAAKTKELLSEADFTNVVPASLAENTTKILSENISRKSSQTEQ